MRINKFIGTNTPFSRRKADELIAAGRVFVNNKRTMELGLDVDPDKDIVKIDGKPISVKSEKIYLALFKPKGYVSTRSDEHGRKTIMELLPQDQNLKPVGRLDYETEGLLLVSNDGEFINHHTHPKFETDKEYVAMISGVLTPDKKKLLESGIVLDGKKTHPGKITIENTTKTETFLRIVIHEGRNRQIRKMFDYIGMPVKYLKRIRIGKIHLGTIEKGKYRKLTKQELDAN